MVSAECSSMRIDQNHKFACDGPINLSSKLGWYSGSYSYGSSYTVTFLNKKFYFSAYAFELGMYSAWPKGWEVSGFDGNEWIHLSSVEESGFNQSKMVKVFYNKGSYGPFDKIRFTNTKENYYGVDNVNYEFFSKQFYFHKLDFFGFLEKPISCAYRNNAFLYLFHKSA